MVAICIQSWDDKQHGCSPSQGLLNVTAEEPLYKQLFNLLSPMSERAWGRPMCELLWKVLFNPGSEDSQVVQAFVTAYY